METMGLHRELRPWADALITALRRAGYRVTVTSVVRSRAQQARLYQEYLAGRNPYPVAPPGRSAHELGLAWDMDVRAWDGSDGAPAAGEAWRGIGGRWSPSDRVHFTV